MVSPKIGAAATFGAAAGQRVYNTFWPEGREDAMRFGFRSVVAATLCLTMLAATASAQDATKGKGKGKREATTVELKDVPAAVTDAAKKELPNATWASAEKMSAKKQGTMFVLEGKDGKYSVSLTMSSSGELMRLMKTADLKKKKAT